MGKNSLVMDTFATCFVIFRLNPERYNYKLFISKVTHMDLIITQTKSDQMNNRLRKLLRGRSGGRVVLPEAED